MRGNAASRMQQDFLMASNASEYNKMKSPGVLSLKKKLKKARNAQTESVYDQWEIQHQNHVSKLSLVILIYLFNQDDGVISKKEKKIISKITKKSVQYLTYAEYMSLSDIIKEMPDTDYVISYIRDHKMKENTVRESIVNVKEQIKSDPVYNKLVKVLETKYITNQ